MESKKRIYLDHAATTPLDIRVKEAMEPFWSKDFGNPGGIYKEGIVAKKALSDARDNIAGLLSARSQEIIFTSGGTEANNLAIIGFAEWLKKERGGLKGSHFITSKVEHPSVKDCFRELEIEGASVSYVDVTSDGIFDLEAFKRALTPETVFVSLMWANNEIGTFQPISEVSKILRDFRKETRNKKQETNFNDFPLLHTDASQVPLFEKINVEKAGVDFLVLDGQKVYGPKGVGLLWKKKGLPLKPIIYGGKQESHMRPGTENVPGIVGFAKAIQIAEDERVKDTNKIIEIRNEFIDSVLKDIPGARLNGHKEKRLPNNIHISFPNIDHEWLVLELDGKGIAVGTRSACLSGSSGASYVLEALQKNEETTTENLQSGIRITMGRSTTKEDMKYVFSVLKEILT